MSVFSHLHTLLHSCGQDSLYIRQREYEIKLSFRSMHIYLFLPMWHSGKTISVLSLILSYFLFSPSFVRELWSMLPAMLMQTSSTRSYPYSFYLVSLFFLVCAYFHTEWEGDSGCAPPGILLLLCIQMKKHLPIFFFPHFWFFLLQECAKRRKIRST